MPPIASPLGAPPAATVAWSSESLLYRNLGAPQVAGPTAVFVDGEGTVHWLSLDKGEPLLRRTTDGSTGGAAPMVSGTTLLVPRATAGSTPSAPVKPVIARRPAQRGQVDAVQPAHQSRDAIVADFAGLTRDRHYGDGRLGDCEFIVIDTGGFRPTAESGIVREMAKQTRQAVAEADAVIFVVDVRGGLSDRTTTSRATCATTGKKCCSRPTRPRA